MSVRSDDTDVLLLIPPDFFSVSSDTEEQQTSLTKTKQQLLVSDLLSQVNDLEGRICLIENQQIMKSEQMAQNGNLQHLKRFGSADSLNTAYKLNYNLRSLQTTPAKTQTLPSPNKSLKSQPSHSITNLKQNCNNHQNILTSNEYLNQKEKDNQILQEIYNYFKDRESIGGNIGEPEKDADKQGLRICGKENIHLSTAVFNLNKVNALLKQLEETQTEIECKLRLKGLTAPDEYKDEISPPKYSFKDSTNNCQTESKTCKKFLDFNSSSPSKDFETGDVTIDNKACVQNLDLTFGKTSNDSVEVSKTDAEKHLSSDLTDLLSLGKLWGCSNLEDDPKWTEDMRGLRQKYQEEHCRRQHCEDLIQKLQVRLLEEQQKVAVAIRVDQEKDEAISKLMEGWMKLVSYWRILESQRCKLENQLETEREKFESEVSAACQTVKRYETELSKALDLAHGYKEKCEASENEKKTVITSAGKEIESLKNDLKGIKDKLQSERGHVERLEKLLVIKEDSLGQAMTKICDMHNQIRELKKNLKELQAELEVGRLEKDKISEKLKDEKCRVSGLEQSKKILLQANEELKKKEKSLKENVKTVTDQVDKIKVELKEFYQNQVEKIVQEKLKEFQEQLSLAERSLQKEIEEREKTISEMAIKQVQQIVEKHVVEVNLLEEKHKEELELWKASTHRAEEAIAEMQKKLDQYTAQKTEIADKLHTVMEAQWQEALKIITASSPQQCKVRLWA